MAVRLLRFVNGLRARHGRWRPIDGSDTRITATRRLVNLCTEGKAPIARDTLYHQLSRNRAIGSLLVYTNHRYHVESGNRHEDQTITVPFP